MKYADNTYVTCPGNPIHNVYGSKVNFDGTIKLETIGVENTDEIIQSYAESTDISFILAKLAAGDTSVLNRRQVSYGDFTNVPKSFAEVLQMQIDSRKAYDALSADVKAKFNNDPNQFFASAGSEEWFKNLGVDVKMQKNADIVPDQKEGDVTE